MKHKDVFMIRVEGLTDVLFLLCCDPISLNGRQGDPLLDRIGVYCKIERERRLLIFGFSDFSNLLEYVASVMGLLRRALDVYVCDIAFRKPITHSVCL